MVHWKNTLVRDYIYLLEYDPHVCSYDEQPCEIAYTYKGLALFYIPNFLVQRAHQKSTIISCTPSKQLHDLNRLAQWTAASLWCLQKDYTFALVTERTLQPQRVLLENLRILAVHAHRTVSEPICEYLLRTVTMAAHPLSLAEIIEQTPQVSAKIIPGAIWHLLAVSRLTTDLTQPLHVVSTRIGWQGASYGTRATE